MLYFHFHLSQIFFDFHFDFSWTLWLLRSILFNFHILMNFPTFFLLWVSSFIPLWSEKILGMISIFLNLLRLVLWSTYDVSWRMLHEHLRRMCTGVTIKWNVLCVSVRFVSSVVLSESTVSLLIFCHDEISIIESEVLKYPTIIVLLSISPFSSINICLIYLGTMMLSTCIFIIVISS